MFSFLKSLFWRRSFGAARSPQWRKVRKEHLRKNPFCAVSGSKKKLEIHHVIPFNIDPSLELEELNLITLSKKYHLIFGHLGSYHSYNPFIVKDAEIWLDKIKNRD